MQMDFQLFIISMRIQIYEKWRSTIKYSSHAIVCITFGSCAFIIKLLYPEG